MRPNAAPRLLRFALLALILPPVCGPGESLAHHLAPDVSAAEEHCAYKAVVGVRALDRDPHAATFYFALEGVGGEGALDDAASVGEAGGLVPFRSVQAGDADFLSGDHDAVAVDDRGGAVEAGLRGGLRVLCLSLWRLWRW